MEALDALRAYGFSRPNDSSEIWNMLVAHAPEDPLRVYITGAAHGSDFTCTQASPYTLRLSLSLISEADVLTMGAVYLRRLTLLHVGRVAELKRIIRNPPPLHTACAQTQPLRELTWKEGVTEILLLDHPQNTSESTIMITFGPLASRTRCAVCKERLTARINNMCREWSLVPRTI